MIGKLDTVVLDAPDIARLSAFYQSLAGWKEVWADDDWITLETPDGWRIGFQSAPDHRPPTWPTQERPQQAHLDVRVPDLDAATAQAVSLGGAVLRRDDMWHTVADPAGHPFDLCLKADNPAPTVAGVMLDCPDAAALSAFYAELLGKPVTYEAPGMAMIGEDGAQPVMFQEVADYAAPRWPDPAYPQQLHLDVHVDDLDAAERSAIAIGATRLPAGTDTFRVFTDPAGKPFCLTIPG
ncbi:VOC family protein [Asanoa sp. WMMD1127]|uniref:VOC family protein n=1 Tax=Asanoa sp. WMMD1127 TaxID=3016107 RepID=UPI0024177DD6|nr:VOC family protein [Asanoa sp. WMMD1127]MDG4826251.1 VOC family protein [Asanoa sp. WMMD1127]